MAKEAQLVAAWDASDRAQLVPAFLETAAPIVVVVDIDGGNVDSDLVTITDATSSTPTIELAVRSASITGAGWWNVVFQLTGANGKRPFFKVNRSDNIAPSTTPPSSWMPAWTADTTDHTSWIRASSRSDVGGSTGTYEWQFDSAFDSDTVVVAMEPMGRVSDADALAAELLVESFCSPAPSADVNGVFHTSPTETDEDGRAIGGHDMYALEFDWGGSTDDGGPKRVCTLGAQIHAQGESCSWITFRFFLDWLINSVDAKAVSLRANWKFYVYFAITPNGLYGGHRRWNFRVSTDPNRDWASTTLSEITALKAAIDADVADGGRYDAQLFFHAGYTTTNPARAYFVPDDESSGTRSPVIQAIGDAIAGYLGSSMLYDSSGTLNTAPWWAKTQKGVKLYADIETPALGSTALSSYQAIAEAWGKGLHDLDAARMFYLGLEVQDATHAHSAENATLSTTGAVSLTVADALHGHAVDNVALSTNDSTTLTAADATHALGSDAPTLQPVSGGITLVINDATHAHTAENLALTLNYVLLVADALHAHSADSMTLPGFSTWVEQVVAAKTWTEQGV